MNLCFDKVHAGFLFALAAGLFAGCGEIAEEPTLPTRLAFDETPWLITNDSPSGHGGAPLYGQRFHGGALERVLLDASAEAPAFSPNGEWLTYYSPAKSVALWIRHVDVDGWGNRVSSRAVR